MTSLRVIFTLVLALILCFAAAAAAQPIGPFCVDMEREGEDAGRLEIFALPMGGSQFLLSAVSSILPWSGAAALNREVAVFTLMAGAPFAQAQGAAAVIAGAINLETGEGEGTCSTLDATTMEPTCETLTPLTLMLVSCD